MKGIKYCLYCGGEEHTVSTMYNERLNAWTGIVLCNHCQASGSICGGEKTEEEARQTAIDNWNNAYRPSNFQLTVRRKWYTLCYRIATWWYTKRK